MIQRSFLGEENSESCDEPGAFVWHLGTDALYGDGAVAQLYGLCPDAVIVGLPLQAFTDKIHSEDRPFVAKAIHAAIVTGEAYNASFRIVADNMTTISVVACGRCFRDSAGIPSLFSGIVFPATGSTSANDTLLGQMIAAHRAAVEEGNAEIANGLDILVRKLAAKRQGVPSYASH